MENQPTPQDNSAPVEQPVIQPVSQPVMQPQPVITPQPAMVQPNYQPFAEQPVQQVHYVVNQKSLEGIGGWLMFFVVVFVLNGLGNITLFFSQLSTFDSLVSVIFAPIIAIGSITSVVLINMRKKIGKYASIATLATMGIYSAINVFTTVGNEDIAVTIGTAVTTLVVSGLFALYFVVSKRVNQTLIK